MLNNQTLLRADFQIKLKHRATIATAFFLPINAKNFGVVFHLQTHRAIRNIAPC